MKMKQISDSTIKITINLEDLEERGMELSDFLVPQEKTEDFFYAIMDELEMPESFLDSGMLSFRVTPKNDRLDIFVTKSQVSRNLDLEDLGDLPDLDEMSQMSPDEFIKTLEKSLSEHSKADQLAQDHLTQVENQEEADELVQETSQILDQFIYYILDFASLEEAVTYVQKIDYEVDTSELYKMNGRYYLTLLIYMENKPGAYPSWLLARMREHANDTDMSRSYLQEHGRLLLVHDAVEDLRKVKTI